MSEIPSETVLLDSAGEAFGHGAQPRGLRGLEPPVTADESLVFLNVGDFGLLTPGTEIYTLMPAQKIQVLDSGVGSVLVDEYQVPVFGLNKGLQILPQLPATHMTVVVFRHDIRLFAFGCARIQKLDRRDVCIYPVPISMSSRKQPFSNFAIIDQCAAGLINAKSLWQLLVERKFNHLVGLAAEPVLVQGGRK